MIDPRAVGEEGIPATVSEPGSLPGGYGLRSPIPVSVWPESGEFVADSPDVNIHAFGPSADEAVDNLGGQIVDQWLRLEAFGDRLAPRMSRDRDRLRALIVPPDR